MTAPHAAAPVDLLLTGGRITTLAPEGEGPGEAQSLAIAGGRVLAVGTDEELAAYAPQARRVIDLGGRRVIPGLIDSHIHAVRGGVSWLVSVHWDGIRSIADALGMIRERAAEIPAGEWIPVIGGWHRRQFVEGRIPTPAELTQAAPQHPVYIQETYDIGVLNAAGMAACGWADAAAENPARGSLERDAAGAPTGVIFGMGAFTVPTLLALTVDHEQAKLGTAAMSREFASHGLTGVNDGGGLLLQPSDYDALFDLWRENGLSLRFRLFISAWERGSELANYTSYTGIQQHDFGDGIVKVSGVGEVVHLGCHDLEGMEDFQVADEAADGLLEISRMCAARGWRMSMHAVLDDTLGRVLDAWEKVQSETAGVTGNRWSIVHADAASDANLDRMAALGLGVLVQNRHVLKGGDYVEHWGADEAAHAQPIAALRQRGIPIGAGTDATRANWYSPWASIAWFVTGRSVDGTGLRAPQHLMSREEALRAYSADAAWFTGEDDHRGTLLPGFDADLTVPTLDPLTCSDDELADIRSELTIMGGRVTWASAPFTNGVSE
ncbi:amidohydrolase [Parafrigoribacterium soli]|uniref:amidohydrolase n=1 Tax=Parafrigoribacterium soli TaxID=3144663 RepID=UPI0032EEA8A2